MTYEIDHSRRHGRQAGAAADLAYGLGWFSIALGALEVAAPGALARGLGMPESEPLLRAYGMREIANGLAILASDDPTPWMWTRVGGDALDLATLAAGYHDGNPRKENVGIALAAVAGVAALDLYCATALSRNEGRLLPDWSGEPERIYDYRDRSGYPMSATAMRGAAADFEAPRDFRTPEALRPWDGG